MLAQETLDMKASMPSFLVRRISTQFPVISAALLAGVIAMTIWLAFEYQRQIGQVQHTLEVQKQLSALLSTVQDAETGVRGFLLAGDDVYLEVYERALVRLPASFEGLRLLVSDNAERTRKLSALRPVVENRIANLREAIAIRRASGLAAAAQYVQTNRGRNIMLEVRALIADLQDTESSLYDERQSNAQRLIYAAAISAAIGLALLLLSLAAWIWSSRQHARGIAAAAAQREYAESQMRQMQKIEALGQLTGGVAHDFNNMLAVITSGLSLIKRRLATGNTDVAELIDATMDGATRAAALTSRLMAFARQQPLEAQAIDASKLVQGLAEILDRTLGAGIAVETRLAPDCWLTLADPAQLESAMLNLCVNARDAMEHGGKLTITTSNVALDNQDYVHISVTDTGIGMPPEVAARAFDPFYTTKEVGKGTGLGLSQVHGFVTQTGGNVSIASRLGEGATINIYLLRHRGAEVRAPDENPLAPRANSAQLILVVDDEAGVRELSGHMLHDLGYRVLEADGAEPALALLDANPDVALLFTDIVMPVTNGQELAKEAVRRHPGLKVLFTTGYSRHDNFPGELGGVIAKPFTLEALAERVEKALA